MKAAVGTNRVRRQANLSISTFQRHYYNIFSIWAVLTILQRWSEVCGLREHPNSKTEILLR